MALTRTEFEILYGGARGGGKTDAGIHWLLYEVNHPRFRALVIRRNAEDLSDWVDRARRWYAPARANFAYRPTEIKFPSGAIIKTGHLKDDNAYGKYQGHEYQKIVIEELTQIPEEKRYLQLMSSCRSVMPELRPQMFLTTNPDGPGHGWVKERFVDAGPYGATYADPATGLTRVYFPATLDDNPTLTINDPAYVKRIDALKEKDPDLWRAWRLGDWDIFSGMFFKTYRRDLHVCEPLVPAPSLSKIAGVDWGYSPGSFVFLAGALQNVEWEGIKFNRLWVYKEISGTERNPREWAETIKQQINLSEFSWIRGDPSMNIKRPDGSVSIIQQFQSEGITILPANNDRQNGWAAFRNWLSIAPDGLPYMMISENCPNLIKTIPAMVHDENNREDIDQSANNDHWVDGGRYMLIHTRWVDARAGAVLRPIQRIMPPKFVGLIDPSKFEIKRR